MVSSPSIIFPSTAVELKVISVYDGKRVSALHENGRYEYELDSS